MQGRNHMRAVTRNVISTFIGLTRSAFELIYGKEPSLFRNWHRPRNAPSNFFKVFWAQLIHILGTPDPYFRCIVIGL
jgi:hypothetical protein